MTNLKGLLIFCICLLSLHLLALDSRTAEPPVIHAKYLLAFHACNTATIDCRDTRNHQVYVAQSDDGISWSLPPGYVPYSGSVPDIIRRGNTLYVYTPSGLRRYRIDTAAWKDPSAVSVTIRKPDGAVEMFVDPSPILDDSGRIVLFYLVGQSGGDPARCPSGQATCTKTIRSATEKPGSDGAEFLADDGNRAEFVISSSETASDPDIFSGPEGLVLYVARNGGVQALQSVDLRGSYLNVPDLADGMLTKGGSVPAGYYDAAAGEYWTYVHRPTGQIASIFRAVHRDLREPIPASSFVPVVSGSGMSGLGNSYAVESPGFEVNMPDMCAATLSDAMTLHVPVLLAGATAYWADFQYVQDSMYFSLIDAGEIADTADFGSCNPSQLSPDLILNIHDVWYGGLSYWVDLQYFEGLLFTLANGGMN